MASKLYQNAVATLGASASAWQAAHEKIEHAPAEDSENQSGRVIVDMIEGEHQLSTNPGEGEPGLMAELLTQLAAVEWPKRSAAFTKAYEAALRSFALKGPATKFRPDVLFRYCNGPGLMKRLLTALRGSRSAARRRLALLISSALNGRDGVTWTRVVEMLKAEPVWRSLPKGEAKLSGGDSVFVTFDHGQHTERDDARWLHEALALWKPLGPCLIEVRYGLEKAGDLHFPTLADAGWFRYFRSAEPTQDHGWTRPRSGTARQPEAVHGQKTLDVVASPDDIRLVPDPHGTP
ncbi:hypothetical protein H8D79_01085 [PVC group bacterium]|nr:hypothetical protein [PVC group bacterium]